EVVGDGLEPGTEVDNGAAIALESDWGAAVNKRAGATGINDVLNIIIGVGERIQACESIKNHCGGAANGWRRHRADPVLWYAPVVRHPAAVPGERSGGHQLATRQPDSPGGIATEMDCRQEPRAGSGGHKDFSSQD